MSAERFDPVHAAYIFVYHWNGFVLLAYHHHQLDAIFLAGILDLKASLPHS